MGTKTSGSVDQRSNSIGHTPGPWQCQVYGKRSWGIFHLSDGVYGGTFAEVNNIGFTNESRDQAEANAHLIAAAPDLLAACEAALAARFGGDDPCCDADPLTNQLRAAIAKAKGGAA